MIDNGSPPVWDITEPWSLLALSVPIVIVVGLWVYIYWRFSDD